MAAYLESGVDKNKNGVLNSLEVDHTQFLCNGANDSTGNQDSIVYLEIPSYPDVPIPQCLLFRANFLNLRKVIIRELIL